MKLGFIITKSTHGGGERMQQMLMQELIKRGHEVMIFTWEDSFLNDFNTSLDKKVLRKKGNKIYQFFYEIVTVYKHLKIISLDCLIIFGTNESFTIASYLSRSCSISTLRVDPRFPPHKRFNRTKRLLFMYLNSGLVFQTDKVRDYFPNNIRKKSCCISNPIIDELPDVDYDKENEIVAVGRLSKEKNYEMLIKAFVNIDHKDFKLLFYGDGKESQNLKKLAANTPVKNNIVFHGNVDNVYNYIKKSKIFVICSDYEGMPNALIEAMSMGLACVSTNFPSGGAEYLINHNNNGLLIPTGDQEKLEQVLCSLIQNENLTERLGQNAIKIRERLNKSIIIDSWLNFIESKKRNNEFFKSFI